MVKTDKKNLKLSNDDGLWSFYEDSDYDPSCCEIEGYCKPDFDALEEIRKRGTIKGSDYDPVAEAQLKRKALYSEKGWF